MTGYVGIHPVAGIQPETEIFTPDTTQRWPLGMVIDAVDSYFGYGRFMYLKAGAAEDPGRLIMVSDETFVTADIPNTANTGYPALVARQIMAINTYGWYQFEGVTPIQTANSVAAGTAAGIAAGTLATNSTGKQLLGCRVLEASTFTLTKSVQTYNGSPWLSLSNVRGLFKGLVVTGTGIAGGSPTIALIDPSGMKIKLSGNSTATATVTATFTYTGFLLCHIQSPHVQGQDAT